MNIPAQMTRQAAVCQGVDATCSHRFADAVMEIEQGTWQTTNASVSSWRHWQVQVGGQQWGAIKSTFVGFYGPLGP